MSEMCRQLYGEDSRFICGVVTDRRLYMAVKKLGGAATTAKAVTEEVAAEKAPVKTTEKKQAIVLDMNDLKGSYAALEAAAKVKVSTGVKSADMLDVVRQLFDETGKDELILSGVATLVKEKFGGKKLYNQLRSSILAKSSPYDLETRDDTHTYIIKAPQKVAEAEAKAAE
jgi:hypothetical protein